MDLTIIYNVLFENIRLQNAMTGPMDIIVSTTVVVTVSITLHVTQTGHCDMGCILGYTDKLCSESK